MSRGASSQQLKDRFRRHLVDVSSSADDDAPEKDATVQIDDKRNYTTIAQRLRLRFGLGDQPHQSEAYYAICQRVAQDFGPEAYDMIADLYHRARSKRKPRQWFCKASRLEFERNGWLDPPDDF